MTVTTDTLAMAARSFAEAFPQIVCSIRPVQSEHVIEFTWTDGPTVRQVEHALKPGVDMRLRLYRHISEDFRALLVDDIELGADSGHDDDPLDVRVNRLAASTAVTADREVRRAS